MSKWHLTTYVILCDREPCYKNTCYHNKYPSFTYMSRYWVYCQLSSWHIFHLFLVLLYSVTGYTGADFIVKWTSKTERLRCGQNGLLIWRNVYIHALQIKKNIKTWLQSKKMNHIYMDCCQNYSTQIWFLTEYIIRILTTWRLMIDWLIDWLIDWYGICKNIRNGIWKYWNASLNYYWLYLHVYNITDVSLIYIDIFINVMHILNQSLVLVTLSVAYIHCHQLQFHHNKTLIKPY